MASLRPSKRRRKTESNGKTQSPENKLKPVVVFAHGAGAPSSSDWMVTWKNMLGRASDAIEVVTFDYPYMAGGKRRAPPKAEKLVEFHSGIVKEAVAKYPGHPLVLAGKSMGSRVSCMVAAQDDIEASVIICLGYPLKGAKGAVRDETLLQLSVPVMFVQISLPWLSSLRFNINSELVSQFYTLLSLQFISLGHLLLMPQVFFLPPMKGNKDGLCPLDKLKAVQRKMKSITSLHVIDGGDHSFKISKKHLEASGLTQDEAEGLAVQAIKDFVPGCLEGK